MENIQNNNLTPTPPTQNKKTLTIRKHNSRSKIFFVIFEIIIFVTFFSGIALGFYFSINNAGEDFSSLTVDEMTKTFNLMLMLIIWICGALLDVFIYAIQSHLENQEKLIDNQIVIAKLISKEKASQ